MAALDGARRYERFGLPNLPAVNAHARLAWGHAKLGTFEAGRTLGDEGLRIAEAAAHRVLGTPLWSLGAVASASMRFTQGIALYDLQQHRASAFLYGEDAGVICHILAARALWYLGYPDQALARCQEAVALVQQIAHPFSPTTSL